MQSTSMKYYTIAHSFFLLKGQQIEFLPIEKLICGFLLPVN